MSGKRERLMFRVAKGCLVPADGYTLECLRERGYRVGDVLSADLAKPRSPGFWALAHKLGQLCADNIERFHGMDAHRVLKALQLETEVACEIVTTEVEGFGVLRSIKPQSMSFENMDQGAFFGVMKTFCGHVSAKYWPQLSGKQIADMSGCMVDE